MLGIILRCLNLIQTIIRLIAANLKADANLKSVEPETLHVSNF